MNKSFITNQNYIKELSIPEHIILWVNVILALAFFITQLCINPNGAYKDWRTWLTFITTVLSIFSVMAGAKQRILCPFIGIICSIMLVPVAWTNHLYGSMIMYGCNIIIQTWSLAVWIKNQKKDKQGVVEPSKTKWWVILIYILCLAGITVGFAFVEGIEGFYKFWSGGQVDKQQDFIIRLFDATNLIFTLGCVFPMIKRYNWVWITYIICDVGIAGTWVCKGILDAPNMQTQFQCWTMVVSGLGMLATCIVGLINWNRALKKK